MRDLVEGGAGGLFWSKGEINLHPKILLQDSVFQDGVALHEYTHFLDIGKKGLKTDRPYHPEIKVDKTEQDVIKKLDIYKSRFSIDEIKAYRTSLRFEAHKALTAKLEEEFYSSYNRIKKYLVYELIFSEITEKVFAKLFLDK